MKQILQVLLVALAACLALGAAEAARGAGALHEAVRRGDIDEFVGLLQAGHDPNEVDRWGRTVLHAVVVRMQDKGFVFASEAMRYGNALEARDSNGMPPLVYAALTGSIAIATELVRQGADVHTTTRGGASALAHAYLTGHLGIVRLLEDRGATIKNRDTFLTLGISEMVEREMRSRLGKHPPAVNAEWARERLLYEREKNNLYGERLMSDKFIDSIVQSAYRSDERPMQTKEANK